MLDESDHDVDKTCSSTEKQKDWEYTSYVQCHCITSQLFFNTHFCVIIPCTLNLFVSLYKVAIFFSCFPLSLARC